MVLEISEKEMIERFSDGLNKSSSKAKEIQLADIAKKPSIFVEFLEGMKVAAGSAHQLAHYQQNPNWLSIRDLLEKVIETGQDLVTFNNSANPFWFSIENSLKALRERGLKMAAAKALTRIEVLDNLDIRQKVLNEALAKERGFDGN